uniref:coiled-coil domain-containing protein 88B-like isoform X3 n=1 Tax=Podarcis muralis TaxID=64176 RepID=UPI00109FCC9D|nr:coiled-coil domain-containing protein 88B-like isoform X3 [Podarcis muralis]
MVGLCSATETHPFPPPLATFRRAALFGNGHDSPPIGALRLPSVPRLPGNPGRGRSTVAEAAPRWARRRDARRGLGATGVIKMASVPERPGPWVKDHCDYLLDSIDAQLSQLQEPSGIIKGSSDSGKASLKKTAGTDATADLGGCSGVRDREASPGEDPSSWEEDCAWWLVRFLDLGTALGDRSRSDSVCTEDFAAKFNEVLVDPLPGSEEESSALALDLGPLKCATRDPVNTSSPFADYEAALDCLSVDSARKQGIAQLPKGGSEEEWDQEKDLAGRSRDAPPLYIPHRIKSAESLGEQISWLSRKWSTDETWKRVFQLTPLSSGKGSLGSEISPRSIFLGPQQEQRGSEDSFEWVQDPHENTESPLLLEDLRPSQLLPASNVKTVLDGGSPSVGTAGCGHPKETSCPRGSLDVACLCTIRASLVPSNEEDGGGSKTPLCLYPQGAWDSGKTQRPAEIGMDSGATRATVYSHKALGSASDGCMGCRKEWIMHPHCTDGRNEALESKECGSLGAQHHDPQSELNQGWMESFQGKPVAGEVTRSQEGLSTGLSVKKSLLPPQRDLLRSPSCSDGGSKEEDEEFARLCRTSESWKWDASRGSEPSGKRAELGGYRNLEALELEEEKLSQKRAQIREADVSLQSVLQQKKHVALELETFREALEKSQREARRLQLIMEEKRSQADEARADLLLLEYKREACLRDLLALEQELSVLRSQRSQHGAAQADVSRLAAEREELKFQVSQLEGKLSSLKHQLKSSRIELASVKETSGDRAGPLQEVAPGASEAGVRRVQGLERRISALQASLREKELELSRLRQTVSALEAEKASWSVTAESLAEERKKQLDLLRQQKEEELTQLQEELEGKKQQALRELAESLKQAKARALQEQAAKFQKEAEDLRKTIKERNAEIAQQRKAMEQQAKELKQEAQELVQNSLLQEWKSQEAETRAALQMQRKALEEQERKMRGELQEALEKERKLSLALRDEADDLRKRIQVLEGEAREKKGAMEDLRALLQAEKAEALRRLREELELEKEKWRMQLQRAEEEQRLLLAKQRETSQAQTARADCSLAREVALACQRLRDLLPQKAGLPQTLQGKPALLSSSHALRALQEVTEETQHYLRELKREAESQRHQALQTQREKERELRQQQEKLHLENQSALDALKEQLVQEHLEDIATLQSSWVKETAGKEDASLRQQLQKDGEQQSQRSVASGKGRTSCQLASEFKEELKAEVERRLSRDKPMDFHRNLEASGSEFRQFCMGRNEYLHPGPLCSPALNADPFSSQRLFSTPRLLQHLQRRIQELRAENALYCRGSTSSYGHLRGDLTCRSKRHLTSELSSSQLHRKSSWK